MQGLSCEDIREASWGMVDESERTVAIPTDVASYQYDPKTGFLRRRDCTGRIKIKVAGTENEWFFLKSRIGCTWMFTREKPKTWRKEGSRVSLYSLPEVEKIVNDGDHPPESNGSLGENGDDVLTKPLKFDNIEISKMNITKLEPTDGIEGAEVVL